MTHQIKVKEDTHLIREESLEQICNDTFARDKTFPVCTPVSPTCSGTQLPQTILQKFKWSWKAADLGVLLRIPEHCNHQ